MSDENVNKASDEAAEVVKEMKKKSLKVKCTVSYGLPTNKAKYLKHLRPTINL